LLEREVCGLQVVMLIKNLNREVESFNRKLVKCMKCHGHVKVLNMDFKRSYFTTHGLHLNNMGKVKAALMIADVILALYQQPSNTAIELCWKPEWEDTASATTNGGGPNFLKELNPIASKNDLDINEKMEINLEGRRENGDLPILNESDGSLTKSDKATTIGGDTNFLNELIPIASKNDLEINEKSVTNLEGRRDNGDLLIPNENDGSIIKSDKAFKSARRPRKLPVTRSDDFLW
jgi:hypothetical protein